MQFPLRVAYGTVAQLARVAARMAPQGDSKLLRALGGRRGIRQRYRAWGAVGRDASRPLLWMHAPSVGEGLQARPVLQLMRERRPDTQLAYTHFSPSAASFARGLDVDFRDYLVFDTAGDTAVALDALAPTALVFAKLDVWPVLVRSAAERGVRLGLVSATVSATSSRRSGIARALSADAFGRLDAVGAVDEQDAERLIEMGVRREVMQVTGDTRYDQVWQRAQRVDRHSGLLASLASDRPTIVAGSTWPSDEAALLPAYVEARRLAPALRLIIAPHETTPAHCAAIVSWASGAGLTLARIDEPAAASADVVLIDRVGILGDVYAVGSIAFVGGGFHSAGLHSVLEPAAFGMPVLVGPQFQRSRDAVLMLQRRGAVSVESTAALSRQLQSWLSDRAALADAGQNARALVRSGLGAADRSFSLVDRLLT